MRDDTVHLFYQTYGNNEKDAICHAWSTDGIHFERDASNPIFAPEPAAWTCGRAIDAEVARVGDRYLMYYATRTTDYKRQIIGVAEAPADTDFSRGEWRQVGDGPSSNPNIRGRRHAPRVPPSSSTTANTTCSTPAPTTTGRSRWA